jgi:flagella basal body P-ring formation protein FlgA
MRRIAHCLMLLCLFQAAAAWSATTTTTVTLLETATVEHEQLRLSDIARVSGDVAVAELRLGPAPRVGLSRRFDRETLEALIRERYGREMTVTWAGAARATVKRAAAEYPAQTFIDPAREALLDHLRARYPQLARIDIAPVGSFTPLLLPSGVPSFSVRAIRTDLLAKRVNVWVDVSVNGVRAASLPVWFAVNAYRSVVVATRNVARYERVGKADLRIEERDVAGMSEPLAVMRATESLRTRQPLTAGEIVLTSGIETAPSVSRNQEIQVQVHSGGVVIETSGIALQEGRVGDRITVRNPGSRKDYVAKIISEGSAMVSTQ